MENCIGRNWYLKIENFIVIYKCDKYDKPSKFKRKNSFWSKI
jgi:hypothetical protein